MATACIFCSIIRGEIPSFRVLEDDLCVAFLDTHPVFPGHTLLVPRVHHETLGDLPADLIAPFFATASASRGSWRAPSGPTGASSP